MCGSLPAGSRARSQPGFQRRKKASRPGKTSVSTGADGFHVIVFDPAFRFIQNGLDVLDVIAGVVVALVVKALFSLWTATEAAHHTLLPQRFLFFASTTAWVPHSGTVADIDLLSLVLRAGKIIKGGWRHDRHWLCLPGRLHQLFHFFRQGCRCPLAMVSASRRGCLSNPSCVLTIAQILRHEKCSLWSNV